MVQSRTFKIGVCGLGQFASSFVPLFQVHPGVSDVALVDVAPERLERGARHYGVDDTYASIEELCDSDVDAVAIFTPRWMHAEHAMMALEASKHVFCAVPAAISVEDMSALVKKVSDTGLTYMVAETAYYTPSTLYCRDRFRRGDIGHFVYGEGEYLHDMSHGFYEAYQRSGGPEWKRTASFPPMFYPTHSVSMILSVTGARMESVSCLGYVDREDDGVFDADISMWDNNFSNETALFRTSDGGMCRVNEFRRVGWRGQLSSRMSMYGTKGSYEEQSNARVWNTLHLEDQADLFQYLTSSKLSPGHHRRSGEFTPPVHEAMEEDFNAGYTPVHPVDRLPPEFAKLPNGHAGSHHFLVDDFAKAVNAGSLPPNNVWESARNCIPGIIAHESALQGGVQLTIPDLGDPPAG
ncbi:Gfo/Idh/MocA family protein [Phytoactinopolyspora endophytica]|uniref:Gfo/Idh/MocA family protein n=1 Tax=Phytoactinopolyspora endophytica TaxID=1642495 RepID=UPI00101CB3E1|nr:Gfo/Idh/MocA family oxidoreductase [Phytoactinopolyspora endophytica]